MLKTLKGKFSVIYLLLVVLIGIVGISSVFNLYRLSKSIDNLMIRNYKSINCANNMLLSIQQQNNAILIYINSNKDSGINYFSQNKKTFLNNFSTEANNITEYGEDTLVKKIEKYYFTYDTLFSKLQEIRNSSSSKTSMDFYQKQIIPKYNVISDDLNQITSINENAMFKSKRHVTKTTKEYMYSLLILSFIAITSGFFISRFFINKFLTPISLLTQRIKSIKEGDLDQTIEISSQDEIGTLAVEFNNMTVRLKEFENSTLGKLMDEKNKSIAIVKSIFDPLIVLDLNFKIILLNTACENFFRIKENCSLNKHILEVFRNNELYDFVNYTFSNNVKVSNHKLLEFSEGGKNHYFNVTTTPINDNNSKARGILVLFKDITESKLLEISKTEFISTISHEFKTPLTSIMMGTNLIMDSNIGELNQKQKDILETMREDGEHLSELVTNLLELSRVESGESILKIEPCSVIGIIDKAIKNFYTQAESKDIELYYEADEDLPKVMADYEKIVWVINNLISNALKHTYAGDNIVVSACCKDNIMQIAVKDTGDGIPSEYVDVIFNKFTTISQQDSIIKGTGLGLAISKKIIESHNGTIECQSTVDVGSSFIFTLPIAQRDV